MVFSLFLIENFPKNLMYCLGFCLISFNIYRTNQKMRKIINLSMLFLFSSVNISNETKYYVDIMIILLFSIVSSVSILLQFLISVSNTVEDSTSSRFFDDNTYIYDSEFKKFGFSRIEYDNLLEKRIKILHYNSNSHKNICKKNDELNKIYLFVKMPYSCSIKLIYNDAFIYEVDEGNLIGGVELTLKKNNYITGIEISNPNSKDILYCEINKKIFGKFITKYMDESIGTKFLFMWGNYLCQINQKLYEYISKLNKYKN